MSWWQPGSTFLQRYVLVGPIGHGGVSVVYHAVDAQYSNPVAIKMLAPRYGADMAAANGHLAQMNSQFAALTAAIEAARPITVLESVSATATAQELARLLSMTGAG